MAQSGKKVTTSALARVDPSYQLKPANPVTSKYFKISDIMPENTPKQKYQGKRKAAAEDKSRKMKMKLKISEVETSTKENVGLSEALELRTHYTYDFYNIPCVDLAKKLLGKVLVRCLPDGSVLRGRIVETESYLGGEDKASQSYQGKKTDRNMPMFMKPGTSYVYLTYGMYHCFNISSEGDGAAVLIRALEPLQGQEFMVSQRLARRKQPLKSSAPFKMHELCNGPGKLTMSFAIDRAVCNKVDMAEGCLLFVEPGEDVSGDRIVVTSRIGIESAGPEWASKPLRFYQLGNPAVSRRDRKAECLIMSKHDHSSTLSVSSFPIGTHLESEERL